jgi:hypothetical protein
MSFSAQKLRSSRQLNVMTIVWMSFGLRAELAIAHNGAIKQRAGRWVERSGIHGIRLFVCHTDELDASVQTSSGADGVLLEPRLHVVHVAAVAAALAPRENAVHSQLAEQTHQTTAHSNDRHDIV